MACVGFILYLGVCCKCFSKLLVLPFFLLLIIGSLKHWNGGFSTAAIIRINYFIQKLCISGLQTRKFCVRVVVFGRITEQGLDTCIIKTNLIWQTCSSHCLLQGFRYRCMKKASPCFLSVCCGQPRFNGWIEGKTMVNRKIWREFLQVRNSLVNSVFYSKRNLKFEWKTHNRVGYWQVLQVALYFSQFPRTCFILDTERILGNMDVPGEQAVHLHRACSKAPCFVYFSVVSALKFSILSLRMF